MSAGAILCREDKIPFRRLLPMGRQHVVAMFGATVLAPAIMNFDPQLAIFFSGVGTFILLAMTTLKVPSDLGSSLPPIVTCTVVAIIGLDLASSAVANAVNAEFTVRDQRDVLALAVAVVTLLTDALVCIHARGFLRLLPVPMGVIVGCALSALLGRAYLGDAAVDFADHRNLVVAGTALIVATGLGVRGITVGGTNLGRDCGR